MSKTIIFDMDGVIFDSENLDQECWRRVADKYGLERIEEPLKKCIGTTTANIERVLTEFYGERISAREFREETLKLFFDEVDKNGMPEKPGVAELMTYLRSAGYRIGLGSSTHTELVKSQLGMAGFLEYFDVIVGGDMTMRSKPFPDIFLLCCELLNGDPIDTIVIEDSYNGIRAAKAAGMIPIMVPDLLPPTYEMKEKSRVILNSLYEVKDYLMKEAG